MRAVVRPLSLPADRRVLVISDIHGNLPFLKGLLKKVQFSTDDILLVLGDILEKSTGGLDTLRYLQDHGAQTIQFVTNGQTSSFVINDLLAQGSGSEVFYLTHRGAEEPTLLLVEADRSELVKD